MTKKRRILVVSEGPEDKWFAKKIFEKFILDCTVEVVTFKTDVYQLYEMYLSYADHKDWENLSLPGVLLGSKKDIRPNERENLRKIFTDIFLIFDFDPQSSLYDPKKLVQLMKHFDDSTNHGQLYINYPMLEAFRCISKNDLANGGISTAFQKAKFSSSDLKKDKNRRTRFKREIAKTGITHKAITREDWVTIIKNHSFKARDILHLSQELLIGQDDLLRLLNLQVAEYSTHKSAYTINTALLLLETYYGSSIEIIENMFRERKKSLTNV